MASLKDLKAFNCKRSLLQFRIWTLICAGIFAIQFLGSEKVLAQTVSKNDIKSDLDEMFAIKSVSLVSLGDNQNGIYAKPLHQLLIDLLKADSQWAIANELGSIELTPSSIQKQLKTDKSEAVLTGFVNRGPKGFSLELSLFLSDGKLIQKVEQKEIKSFELSDQQNILRDLFLQLRRSLPYHGLLQSRSGQDVKMNIGSDYGLKMGDSVSVIQIIGLKRHPKLNFMVGSERESIGKIVVTKVEDHSAFGKITFERDLNLVRPGLKVWAEKYISYPVPLINNTQVAQAVNAQDSKHVFGENPVEWLPAEQPQYGRISLVSGLSSYNQNLTLNTAGGLTASKPLVLNLRLDGEAWINSNWFLLGKIRQNAFTVDNPLGGSTPSTLQMTFSQFALGGGYNFLIDGNFWGPKFQLKLISSTTKFDADTSSPTALTSMTFSGNILGLTAMTPISNEFPLTLGLNFDYYLTSNVSENIASGGNGKATITVVEFFGSYRWSQNFALRGELGFEQYSSSFSGAAGRTDPASSISHKLTNLLVGFDYLF